MKILGHLSRITTPGRTFIPQIDGLRFVAIIAVIAYHVQGAVLLQFGTAGENGAGDIVSRVSAAGHHGVSLFFAVSGFILSLPFAKQYLSPVGAKPIRLRDYFVRRITRIEPPYVIHLFLLLLLCVALRHRPAQLQPHDSETWLGFTLEHIFASLVYLNGFIFGTHPYPNIVLWSLEVEVQFYLLAPFLAKVFMIRTPWMRRTVIAGVMVVAPLISGWLGGGAYRSWTSLYGNIQYFFAGFLLADFYLTGKVGSASRKSGWDIVFLLCVAAVVYVQTNPAWVPLLSWIILLFCMAAFQGKITARLLAVPWLITIGGMCYTIYMYHLLVISTLIRVTRPLQTHVLWLDLLVQFVVMTSVIILVCSVLFVLFERPFMKRDWPATFWRRVNSLLSRR